MNIFGTEVILIRDLHVSQSKQTKSLRINGRQFHSLTYRHSGHIKLHFDLDVSVESRKGMLTFVPQGKNYIHEVLEDSEITAMHIVSDELASCGPFVYKPADEKTFPILFNRIAEIWNQNPVNSSVPLLAAAYKIFETLLGENDEFLKSGNSRIIYEAVRYMRRNFSSPDFAISACAGAAGITEAYLRRIFKRTFNESPGRYLLRLRMDYSRNLLSTGYYSVAEVAYRSGFSGSSHFCSVFRKYCGLTPLAYIRGY